MYVTYHVQFRDRTAWLQTDRRYLYSMVVSSQALHGDAWLVWVDDLHAFEDLIVQDEYIAAWERV